MTQSPLFGDHVPTENDRVAALAVLARAYIVRAVDHAAENELFGRADYPRLSEWHWEEMVCRAVSLADVRRPSAADVDAAYAVLEFKEEQ